MYTHLHAGEGGELLWKSHPFPIETAKETIFKDENCFQATWQVLKRFTTLTESGASRRLGVDIKLQRKR